MRYPRGRNYEMKHIHYNRPSHQYEDISPRLKPNYRMGAILMMHQATDVPNQQESEEMENSIHHVNPFRYLKEKLGSCHPNLVNPFQYLCHFNPVYFGIIVLSLVLIGVVIVASLYGTAVLGGPSPSPSSSLPLFSDSSSSSSSSSSSFDSSSSYPSSSSSSSSSSSIPSSSSSSTGSAVVGGPPNPPTGVTLTLASNRIDLVCSWITDSTDTDSNYPTIYQSPSTIIGYVVVAHNISTFTAFGPFATASYYCSVYSSTGTTTLSSTVTSSTLSYSSPSSTGSASGGAPHPPINVILALASNRVDLVCSWVTDSTDTGSNYPTIYQSPSTTISSVTVPSNTLTFTAFGPFATASYYCSVYSSTGASTFSSAVTSSTISYTSPSSSSSGAYTSSSR